MFRSRDAGVSEWMDGNEDVRVDTVMVVLHGHPVRVYIPSPGTGAVRAARPVTLLTVIRLRATDP